MSLVSVPGLGGYLVIPGMPATSPSNGSATVTLDATNEADIMYGQIFTSDGLPHTLDTTGSSSIAWRANSVTFANAGTTLKVGLAAMDTSTGPPGRAVNVADVITFDVSKSYTGGGGGITAATINSVPDAGSKTVAHGDFIALAVQMTARAGADTVGVTCASETPMQQTGATSFTGGAYAASGQQANAFITFSDGATGYFIGSNVYDSLGGTTAFNSGSSPKEFGQLWTFPFPCSVIGIYRWSNLAAGADHDLVLYSDPLGTPVAERTVSVPSKAVNANGAAGRLLKMFSSPYSLAANQSVVAGVKPTTANNVTIYNKIFASAGHRVTEPYGTTGYGVSRNTGAFANVNSSLTNYYIGLLISAYDTGGYPASRAFLGM